MSALRSELTRLAANAVWLLASLPDALAYQRALTGDLVQAQSDVLRRILARNANTDYGRRHGFATIRGVDDFRARVPLTTYDDYTEYVERIAKGQPGVLSRAPVTLLEPTSGSTAATKYVPYTRELERQFNRAIGPWIVDLFRRQSDLLRGQAYWSISPVSSDHQRTEAGIPIGFADDAAYLGGVGSFLRSALAVPSEVRWINDVDAFRYTTLLFLLRSPRLVLMSVWNPSFLTLLCRPLQKWWSALADDVMLGRLTPPAPTDPAVARQLATWLQPDARRADALRRIFSRYGDDPSVCHRHLWPHLRIISCWADGPAEEPAKELMRLFPQADLQPKGLLATEGIVSIPLGAKNEHALAVRSHFFEFIPYAARDAAPLLAHQLAPGALYEVVLTTDVFYRYRLHDLVQVVGSIGSVPTVRFVGKSDLIADASGEKLNEHHVRGVIQSATAAYASAPVFAMLAYEMRSTGGGYVLFLEWPDASDEVLAAVAAAVERSLNDNYHYQYCRLLGQLEAVTAFRVRHDAPDVYLTACVAGGQRLGDIKPAALHPGRGWAARFDGYAIPANRR